MADSPKPCFICNLFGCRLFCLTPHQESPGIDHFEDQDGQAQGSVQQTVRVPASQVFATKKRRDIWFRNTLVFLYCLGGLSGLLLLATILVAYEIRGPGHVCKKVYIGMQKDVICTQGFLPGRDPMETTDFLLLLNSCLTVLLAIAGIIAAVKKKQRLIYAVSAGFGVVIAAQVTIGATIYVQQVVPKFQWYPYVPVKVQHEVRNYMEDGMHHYQENSSGKRMWDYLQKSTCCCGIDGHDDWGMIAHTSIPHSCDCVCGNPPCRKNSWGCQSNVYTYDIGTCYREPDKISANRTVPHRGCIQQIMVKIGDHRYYIVQAMYIVVFGLTSLQFLAAIGPLLGVCCRSCCVPSTGSQVGMSDLNACPRPWQCSGNDDDDEPLLSDHDQGNHGDMASAGDSQATTHPVA